ncbi:MAG TPA: outer membrane beta-barrel protein [Burkholderiales bacterium]|jgi:hypothetical protein
MKNTAIIAVLGLAAAAFAAPAAAQMRSGAGVGYIGGAVGQSDIKFGACAAPCDTKGKAFKLFGGYQFTPMIAGEVSYNDFGETTFGASNVKGTAWDASAIGSWPIGQFSILGRLGLYMGELKSTTPSTGASIKATSTHLVWGLGGQLNVTNQLGVRAEFTRFTNMGGGDFHEKGDVQTLTVGGVWRFQ